ncbi:hypothetical protein C8A00DRAFT_36946 [Chaetomidium leptoderma]|uniref:Glycine-rich domain-containing protein 1 n=1 Tax=Chaetomidium leptoderma TaxID=669021 RepID=A0AAN6VFC3_9PEZI|nr:hypothetical protein C8A00DRAFT_36946 [Chaetomidium leptoderma]
MIFPAAEEFSAARITDHIWLLQRFRHLFAHAESPGTYAAVYPALPPGVHVSAQRQWRVQAFLMNAEVRYSFYLRLLQEWIHVLKHNPGAGRKDWPLPPWDVAVMFYIHMLSPQRFQRDMTVEYRSLWDAEIAFPLARLRKHPRNDESSQRKWEAMYPSIPYQVFEFGPDGETPHISTKIDRPLDIHGYKCGSPSCTDKKRRSRTQIIPMAEWSAYRLAKRRNPACPSCKREFAPGLGGYNSAFASFCKVVFGQHVFGLWDAPLRQMGFVERILAETRAIGGVLNSTSQTRYLKFLALIKSHPSTTFVPTLDIDLVWHTHQLSPAAYDAYCRAHVGRAVNHDDTIAAPGRSTALDDTKRHWALDYSELFLGGTTTTNGPEQHLETAAAALLLRQKAALYATRREELTAGLAAFDTAHDTPRLQADLHTARQRVIVESDRQTALWRELDELTSALRARERQRDGVRPRIRIGLFRWQYYSKRGREELAWKGDAVRVAGKRRMAKEGELEGQRRVRAEAVTERDGLEARWQEVQRERAALGAQLASQVAIAERAVVWECVVSADKRRGDPLGKGMWSVVPSEAQIMAPPLVGDWSRDRKRLGKSWGATLGYTRPDNVGGGSFGGMAFGPDYSGDYRGSGGEGWGHGGRGSDGGGGGSGGGCGGGGSSSCGGGCGGGGGSSGGGGCGGGGCGGGGCGGG